MNIVNISQRCVDEYKSAAVWETGNEGLDRAGKIKDGVKRISIVLLGIFSRLTCIASFAASWTLFGSTLHSLTLDQSHKLLFSTCVEVVARVCGTSETFTTCPPCPLSSSSPPRCFG